MVFLTDPAVGGVHESKLYGVGCRLNERTYRYGVICSVGVEFFKVRNGRWVSGLSSTASHVDQRGRFSLNDVASFFFFAPERECIAACMGSGCECRVAKIT